MSTFVRNKTKSEPEKNSGRIPWRQRFSHPARYAAVPLLLCSTVPAWAQSSTGDILGTVTDGTGSVVAGATVRLENTGTHQVRTFVTNGSGEYTFTSLQPGTYTVTVGAQSFKTFTAREIVVAAADRVRINPLLQLGSVNEQVEVTTTPSALQTDTTTVGSTVTEKTLVDAPLNGRNYISLVQVQAGANAGSPTSLLSGNNVIDRRLSSSVSANGQQEIFNNNQVDGLDNNSRATGVPMLRPSVEAIETIRTDINLYRAEDGRTGGAVINVNTKAGVNNFHGSLYEFFRNDITDTRSFFAVASIIPRKPELRQNQYGGSLSGPILRDRTFFFVDYEGFRRIDATNFVYTASVPTLAEEQTPGNLTDIGGPNIPTASLDPTGLAYFKLFPTPNLPGTSNNYRSDPSSSLYSSLGDGRIDHHFSANDTLFGRYSYNRTQASIPSPFPTVNGVSGGGVLAAPLPGNSLAITHNGQFGYTHIFTPNLLLELRSGYTYYTLTSVPLNYGQNLNDSAPYRVPNANECNSCSGLATFNVVGYGPLGDSIAQPVFDQEHNTQFSGALTYTYGHHTFKAGAALVRRNFSFQLPLYPKGLFTFAPSAGTPSLQKLLLGTSYIGVRQAYNEKLYDRANEPSFFFQDDWRVSQKLTLNLGMRYDVLGKPYEKYGNFANFDLPSLTLIDNATGGIQNTYHDFSPRFGFDATLAQGLVLRGGFGLTFFPADSNQTLVLNNPPVGFNLGSTLYTTPVSTTGIAPVAAQSTATANLSGALISKPLKETDSYLEQFNLLTQKEYRGTVLTIGYVAALGRHIFDNIPNLDLPAPTGPVAAGTAAPPLLYAKQLPKVTTINYYGNFGVSNYNSLQVSLERRISHGLTANVNYTHAHELDDVLQVFDGDGTAPNGFGLQPGSVSTVDYGNSPLDVRDRFAGFFSYDIPTGKSSGLMKAFLGGFRLNGLGFWQTGAPFGVISTVTQGAASLATINLPTVTGDRPNVVGSYNYGGPLTSYFNVSAFARQAIGTAGNEHRNQLFGPDLRRGDLSLFKTVPLHENEKLELRVECFNFTNTPNFAQPNNTITSYAGPGGTATNAGGFGTISSTAFGFAGRQFQFAGRFSF